MTKPALPPRRPAVNPPPWLTVLMGAPRQTFIALLLVFALLAFEVFNFDTTKFALHDLLGEISFIGLSWAAILAFAFCAIDFAGLIRIFTPEQGRSEPREVWYLMGAWLLGATMNAIMTWYAVALALVNRQWDNTEVLTRDQLELFVPVFVAILVWLTRILFIGSISMASEQLFATMRGTAPAPRPVVAPVLPHAQPQLAQSGTALPPPRQPKAVTPAPQPTPQNSPSPAPNPGRVRQRPPLAGHTPTNTSPAPMSAKSQR